MVFPITGSAAGSSSAPSRRIPRVSGIHGRVKAAAALVAAIGLAGVYMAAAQQKGPPVYRVNVDMVLVTFSVTDSNGKYIRGLTPHDIRVLEDGVPQTLAAFAEGEAPIRFLDARPGEFQGTNVFILFDTSNCMYKGFAYASDAVADFVRSLDAADSVAVYTFSRNLARLAPLTKDHNLAISGLRRAVAGDDTALYNTLLLTLRDAAKVAGRKAVIVFSNGPDNASILSPDDVGTVAEDWGVPIYVVATQDATQDVISDAVFHRLTERTGGRVYWAKNWARQEAAFSAIREDVRSSYVAAYYPAPSANEGFRTIKVEVASPAGTKLKVRVRQGYQARRPS
jgi:Ca-activated chloride channel homolog